MNKNFIILLIILAGAVGAFFFFKGDDGENQMQYTDDGSQIVYCDADGNRYATEAEAKASGLTEAEYGATYCPEYVAAQTGDYTGVPVTQAEEIAAARGEMFRVVEIDGEPQPTTRDFREGRINATVADGVVTSYTIETANPTNEMDSETEVGADDEIIGMTIAEAEAYAEAKGVGFRTGIIDGEALPVTMDFQPGRITAEIENGIVVGYTVE